jgi:hypothetical protein
MHRQLSFRRGVYNEDITLARQLRLAGMLLKRVVQSDVKVRNRFPADGPNGRHTGKEEMFSTACCQGFPPREPI